MAAALTEAIVALAGTPDDPSPADRRLAAIAQLAADTVAGVDYASITALRDGDHTTVAASSAIARAVDEAQYAGRAGPCVRAVDTGEAVSVPDIAATMSWPGFFDAALGMGLHAALSVPLYAGRGAPVAVLNLYARDAVAMAPLIAGVEALHDVGSEETGGGGPGLLDPGAEALLDGVAEAIAARATIKMAIAAIMAGTDRTAEDAYVILRLGAAEAGVSLTVAATALVTRASDAGRPGEEA